MLIIAFSTFLVVVLDSKHKVHLHVDSKGEKPSWIIGKKDITWAGTYTLL